MTNNRNKKLKLLLINPKQKYKHYSTQIGMVKLLGKKNTLAPLSLAILSAYTPDYYDITIIDEEVEPIPFDSKPDIVGITALTNTINRAYEISSKFRADNIPVIFGGPHCIADHDNLLKHADTIVSGEAESIWGNLLSDFESGNLKKIYSTDTSVDFSTLRKPRWDLINADDYISLPVQASRGCPYACEFCLVSKLFGRKKRFRDIDNIIDEIKSLPVKRVFFVDDNLTINKRFAKELLERIKELKISWICQSSIEIAHDDELLQLMADAGCEQILIGFESLNSKSLTETNKGHNQRFDFSQSVQNINKHGIFVLASFVIGFDHDTLEEMDNIFKFTQENGIFYVALNILGFSKGTDLYERLKNEDRIISLDTEFRGGMFPVIDYKNMGGEELFRYYLKTISKMFSFESLYEKADTLFSKGHFKKYLVYQDIAPSEKGRITMLLLKNYLFAKDRWKRKFFNRLLGLFFRGKIPLERVVLLLLSMHGFNSYIKELKEQEEFFVEKINSSYN